MTVTIELDKNAEVKVSEIDKHYIEIKLADTKFWITRDQGYDLINQLEPYCVDKDDQYETLQAKIHKLEMA